VNYWFPPYPNNFELLCGYKHEEISQRIREQERWFEFCHPDQYLHESDLPGVALSFLFFRPFSRQRTSKALNTPQSYRPTDKAPLLLTTYLNCGRFVLPVRDQELGQRMIRKPCKYHESNQYIRRGSLLPTMVTKCVSIAMGTFVVFMMAATPVWAVQTHGGLEGLVSHQIGHLLFTFGMGYLLFRLYSIRPKGAGWLEFKIFLWLLIAWNATTFAGHWMDEFVAKEKFIKAHGRTLAFMIENLQDALYYLTRLDHLILIPSFVFLLLALRKWRMAQ